MEIKINFPKNSCKEDIGLRTSKNSNGFVDEWRWKDPSSNPLGNQWLLRIQKKEDCLILNINEDYLERQESDKCMVEKSDV